MMTTETSAAPAEQAPATTTAAATTGVATTPMKAAVATTATPAPAQAPKTATPASASKATPAPSTDGFTLADVPALLDAGAQAFALGNFPLAAEKLSIASQLKAEAHGPKARECAETLFLYGQALLANAVQKNSVLGGNVDSSVPESSGAAGASSSAAASSSKASGRFVFSGDADEDEEVDAADAEGDAAEADTSAALDEDSMIAMAVARAADEEELAAEQAQQDGSAAAANNDDGIALEELEDEETDDLEIAWETFDLVRVIYTESENPEDKIRLGEVHMALGDVSLESANFDQATTDFVAAVQIKEKYLAADDRELAEAHYKLALALEYSEQFEDAIDQVNKTTSVLEAHLKKIRTADEAVAADAAAAKETADPKGKKAADPVSEEKAKQIAEVETLLGEMASKLQDLRATLAKEEAEGDEIAADESTASITIKDAATQDVSGLVKKTAGADASASPLRKRKPESEEAAGSADVSEESSKKAKTVEGSADA